VYVIVTPVLSKIPVLNASSKSGGLVDITSFLSSAIGLSLYPLFGLILGMFGGVFGDSRAHSNRKMARL
jgi:hypothetical protein